jgi:hypothetical protein
MRHDEIQVRRGGMRQGTKGNEMLAGGRAGNASATGTPAAESCRRACVRSAHARRRTKKNVHALSSTSTGPSLRQQRSGEICVLRMASSFHTVHPRLGVQPAMCAMFHVQTPTRGASAIAGSDARDREDGCAMRRRAKRRCSGGGVGAESARTELHSARTLCGT